MAHETKNLIALIGAGGKMGRRIIPNLIKFGYEFVCCEKNEEANKLLSDQGLHVLPTEEAVQIADTIVLALPDAAIPSLDRKSVV